jgi:hypothetical protein
MDAGLLRSSRCRKATGLSIQPFNLGPLSAPFARSEACRAKENHMRTLVEPPPSSRCGLCGGELLLELIDRFDNEIFVCLKWVVSIRMSTLEQQCIGLPGHECISDIGKRGRFADPINRLDDSGNKARRCIDPSTWNKMRS